MHPGAKNGLYFRDATTLNRPFVVILRLKKTVMDLKFCTLLLSN